MIKPRTLIRSTDCWHRQTQCVAQPFSYRRTHPLWGNLQRGPQFARRQIARLAFRLLGQSRARCGVLMQLAPFNGQPQSMFQRGDLFGNCARRYRLASRLDIRGNRFFADVLCQLRQVRFQRFQDAAQPVKRSGAEPYFLVTAKPLQQIVRGNIGRLFDAQRLGRSVCTFSRANASTACGLVCATTE